MKKTILILSAFLISGFIHAADCVADGILFNSNSALSQLKNHFVTDDEAIAYANRFAQAFSLPSTTRTKLGTLLSIGKRTAEDTGIALLAVYAGCAAYSCIDPHFFYFDEAH